MLTVKKSEQIQIAELQGDGIGPELAQTVAEVAAALPLDIRFNAVDWSLDRRERLGEQVIDEAEEAIRACGVALKYPTVTKSSSPNALFRRRCEFSVIYGDDTGDSVQFCQGPECAYYPHRNRWYLR